jgi:hypothetical protein
VSELTREQLVSLLAEVSHQTWKRQKAEALRHELEALSDEVTDHDLERAEDAVQELERLGIWPARPG